MEKSIENAYEGIKNLQYSYLTDFQKLSFSKVNYATPISYTTVLDTFRTGYEENT
jgi:hypothetical protein